MSADVRNVSSDIRSFVLVVSEVDLNQSAYSVSQSFFVPLQLSPGEERTVRVPIPISPATTNERYVIYLEARNQEGQPIGRTGRKVGPKTDGTVIALTCSTPKLCTSIQQFILLSGSADEQTSKSKTLRMVQLSELPSDGWAYAPANTVILAAPLSRLSSEQRDALEIFLREGGTLVLVEDQLDDTLAPASQNSAKNSASAAPNRKGHFLEPYRRGLPFGKALTVGSGTLVRLAEATGPESGRYFRPLGFTSSTPDSITAQFPRRSTDLQWLPGETTPWLVKRLGTTFHFPSFLEILLWMIGYLLLAGVINFLVLRRMGRQEWAWLTLPAIAVVVSIFLYATTVRNRPRNFGLDDVVVYRMDNLSPRATSVARIRVSAPVRAQVQPAVPVDWVYRPPQRNYMDFGLAGPVFSSEPNQASVREIYLDKNWEAAALLRRWSFMDLDFYGHYRFQGTVYRDSAGRLCNGTGIDYQQAIAVDHQQVFVLGHFPPGAAVDLSRVQHLPYAQETGRSVNRTTVYPGPPFRIRKSGKEGEETARRSEEDQKRMDAEWDALSSQPFSLAELIRGWPTNGDDVFYETKAVFFGLSTRVSPDVSLRQRSPDRKSAALTVVNFQEWP